MGEYDQKRQPIPTLPRRYVGEIGTTCPRSLRRHDIRRPAL